MPALGSSPVISIVMRETPTLSGDTSRTVLGLRGSSNVTNSGQAPSSRGLPPGKGLGRVRGKSTGPAILTLARRWAARFGLYIKKEQTSELQSLIRSSYAAFRLKIRQNKRERSIRIIH